MRNSWVPIGERQFAEIAVVTVCVVFAVIANTITCGRIIGAAICMVVTLTGCNKKDIKTVTEMSKICDYNSSQK